MFLNAFGIKLDKSEVNFKKPFKQIGMKKIYTLLVGLVVVAASVQAQDTGLPSNPTPGKCYIKCVTPDEFGTETEKVMISPEYNKIKIIPATYKTVTEEVLVKEATKKYTYVPATYETVDVPFVSKEGRTDLAPVDAKFGSDSKTIETYPANSRWEYTILNNCPSANKTDCQVLCWKEYPAESQTVSMKTLVSDATTSNVSIPEVKATYKKQVIKTPARVDEVVIPEVKKTISRQVVDKPARVEKTLVPAEYKTVTKTTLTKKGGVTVWEEVDCKLVNGEILPILYDLNSAALTPESKRIIDEKLLKLMKDKPNVSVEISSHTDSRGNDDYNMALSQRRAESVVNYLVSKGISKSRLIAKGYGETRLKNRCGNGVSCTESEHHQNRRTEFRVLQN